MKTETELPASVLTKKQTKQLEKFYSEGGKRYRIRANIQHDDQCGNVHNSFSITGKIDEKLGNGQWREDCGGCIHKEIAKHFPQLAPFIKWHLTSTDGPMHYIANTVYLAGDRDHNGHAAGEPCGWEVGLRFDGVPVTHRVRASFWKFLKERYQTGQFQVIGLTHDREPQTYGTHYTFAGYGEKWHECPFSDKAAADEFCAAMNKCAVTFERTATQFSEGKARELDAARRVAIWPEATDEDLTAPGLEQRLADRLPALMADLKAAVESLGFVY